MTPEQFTIAALVRYDISPDGHIYRTDSAKWLGGRPAPREVKQTVSSSGYLEVQLCMGRVKKHVRVHRLVAARYLGWSNLQVNHIDGDKKNNHITNLTYVTARQNVQHFFENRECRHTVKNGCGWTCVRVPA